MSLLSLLILLVCFAGLGIVIGLPCGPPCLTCGCVIGSDDFNRADNSEPGIQWYKLNGDCLISSQILYVTASDSIIRFEKTRSSSLGQHVTVDLYELGSSADLPRVFMDLVDVDNCHFVEFDTSATTFSFYKRSAGVDTLIEAIVYDTTLTAIDVCFTAGDFKVGAGGDSWKVVSTPHNGDYVGLGCGALSGYVGFDNFVLQKVSADCPGCPCEVCSDSFLRPDSSDINDGSPCGCTVFSGTWDITSNQLRCTSAGIMALNTPHPDGYATMIVETSFKHSQSGSACDIIVSLIDSTHYYYVRYKPGTNTVDIRLKNGLSDSSVTPDIPTIYMTAGVWYEARVCVSPNGDIVASLNGNPVVKVIGTGAAGTYAGLGASGSGTATFSNFRFEKFCELCPTPCNALTGCYEYEFEMEVVIGGISTDQCTGDCTEWNSTFIVPFTRSWQPIGLWFECDWILDGPIPPFNCGSRIRLEFSFVTGGGPGGVGDAIYCQVLLYTGQFTSDIIVFRTNPYERTEKFNCSEIVNLNVPYVSGGSPAGEANCVGSSATCTVTLL